MIIQNRTWLAVSVCQQSCSVQENPHARVTATDVSPTAVRLFEAAALRAGIATDRVRAFACDSADAGAGDALLSGVLGVQGVQGAQ